MPTYVYKAKDLSGNTITGTIEAASERQAAEEIQRRGQWILSLRPERVRLRSAEPWWAFLFRPRLLDLIVFYREMATLFSAGMTVFQALSTQAEQTPSGRLARICREMLPDAERGTPLSELMRRYPWAFSEMAVGLVRAGEVGGMLDTMMERLAEYYERELEVRNAVRWRLLYLKAILVVFVLVSLVISVLAPALAQQRSPTAGELLPPLLPWAGVFLAWIIARLALATSRPLQLAYDTVKLYLPLIGGLVRQLACAKFSRALASMVAAGVPAHESLVTAARVTGNAAITKQLLAYAPAVQAGRPLSEILRATGHFPYMVVQMVQTGEQTGELDAMLGKVADYYESHAVAALKSLVMIGFALCIIGFAIVVGITAVRFYLGYFQDLLNFADSFAS